MTHVNFIPLARRQAGRRRRHIRRWSIVCLGYAFILALVFGGTRVGGAGVHDLVHVSMDDLDARTRESQARAALLLEQLNRTQAELRASEAAADQPDWSVLLALLARSLGDDVVLRRCELWPNETTSSGAIRGRRLDLSGLGRSQRSVSRFVLRLEDTRLFSQVTLQETQREPFLRDQAVAFRIECRFDATEPSEPEPTTP